ncbi:hypothetical protein GCM10010329_52440 [Streptomyces spiroverticillatus]|uniref:Proteophosphoglycan 5 n=1 Tax=Streptomyces finlayi TaxID=67296 RepID=A0A918X1W4_9ACTN|nr:hypothetical protein [Streptomyces finlayi]GHA22599.1 hypothetical protein GCM10010329_52440 [Streptomyces spiroverticillatus]GHD04497.1 hypothetical protein GCM10010334_53380 [Streptomyces finlayi]
MSTAENTTDPSVHRPGRPEDLPAAPVLWARWGLLAGLLSTREREAEREIHRAGYWMASGRDDTLRFYDGGASWWALRRAGDGRYVLYGEDESSEVKWQEEAIDVLGGAPDWLPLELLRDLVESYMIGCVYWYEDGAWARAPYPAGLADDGLDCGMSRLFTTGRAADEVEPWMDHETADPDAEVDPEAAARLLTDAVSGSVGEEAVRAFLVDAGLAEEEIPGALVTLRRTGLLAE